MEFIELADIADTILNCRDCDVSYANDYLYRLATSFGLTDAEIQTPARTAVKQLGCVVACRECAAACVGTDPTVMVDGNRADDVYYQKWKMYAQMAKDIESRLTYSDFAVSGTDSSGKGGVGVIRLSRA